MATADPRSPLRASVIDRLSGARTRRDEAVSLRELQRSVARDLEWLLNSRVQIPEQVEHLEEARRSVLAYGVPELSGYSWKSESDRRLLASRLEEAIRCFEPRLQERSVRVEILEPEAASDFKLPFRIHAVLHVEPIRERVSFDADLDFDSTTVHVGEGG